MPVKKIVVALVALLARLPRPMVGFAGHAIDPVDAGGNRASG
jgi:hypothetical protein